MHAKSFAAAVFRRCNAVGDGAHPIVEQRRIDEARPDIQRVDEVARQVAKTPGLVGVHDQIVFAVQQPVIEITTPRTNFGAKIRMQP